MAGFELEWEPLVDRVRSFLKPHKSAFLNPGVGRDISEILRSCKTQLHDIGFEEREDGKDMVTVARRFEKNGEHQNSIRLFLLIAEHLRSRDDEEAASRIIGCGTAIKNIIITLYTINTYTYRELKDDWIPWLEWITALVMHVTDDFSSDRVKLGLIAKSYFNTAKVYDEMSSAK